MKISKSSFVETKDRSYTKGLINNLSELGDYISYLSDLWNADDLWFRGVPQTSFKLCPSIYRNDIWEHFFDGEKALAEEFIHKGKTFADTHHINSKWEWYQLMQHYGLPTRLLDWSEGYLMSLFFALRPLSSMQKFNSKIKPCIWVLNPFMLNLASNNQKLVYYSDLITQETEDKCIDSYLYDINPLAKYPLALFPPNINSRIRAQKSCFTIHGKYKTGFELLHRQGKLKQIVQLRINPDEAMSMKYDLSIAGITEGILFPDLEGLAREIKYRYGMKI